MDYYFNVGVSRDEIVDCLKDSEHSPYVFSNIALFLDGTYMFDDFCDGLEALDDEQREALLAFCQRVARCLSEND